MLKESGGVTVIGRAAPFDIIAAYESFLGLGFVFTDGSQKTDLNEEQSVSEFGYFLKLSGIYCKLT